ncbi:MAG: hypothetical protein ACOYN0_04180 [Phycisphaerales bacterium]
MSSGGSTGSGGMSGGFQGSAWPALAGSALHGPSQGAACTFAGPDAAVALAEVRRAADRLRHSLGTCTDLTPILAPVVTILQGGANRVMLAAIDEFQAFYGLLATKMAEKHIDVREVRGADGKTHNSGAEVEEFLEAVGQKAGASWCAAFVYTCHAEAASLLGGYTTVPQTALASAVWVQSKSINSRFTVADVLAGNSAPRAGDLFVFEQVLDTLPRAVKARDAALKQAESQRRDRLAVAIKDATKDPALAPGLDAKKKWIQEQYDKAVAAAKKEYQQRSGDMREGVKMANNLAGDKQFWADPKAGKSGSHTGVVKSFDPSTNRMVTIEGNTSSGKQGSTDGDGVYERNDRMDRQGGNRKYPQLYGFVRPKFRPA